MIECQNRFALARHNESAAFSSFVPLMLQVYFKSSIEKHLDFTTFSEHDTGFLSRALLPLFLQHPLPCNTLSIVSMGLNTTN